MTLLVSNLDLSWTDDQLGRLFAPFGTVTSSQIAIDGFTGQSRGFGYVEMEADDAALSAMAAVNGSDHEGRTLRVEETETRKEMSGSYKVRSGSGIDRAAKN